MKKSLGLDWIVLGPPDEPSASPSDAKRILTWLDNYIASWAARLVPIALQAQPASAYDHHRIIDSPIILDTMLTAVSISLAATAVGYLAGSLLSGLAALFGFSDRRRSLGDYLRELEAMDVDFKVKSVESWLLRGAAGTGAVWDARAGLYNGALDAVERVKSAHKALQKKIALHLSSSWRHVLAPALRRELAELHVKLTVMMRRLALLRQLCRQPRQGVVAENSAINP
jgi:hypothetical protein